MTTDHPISFSAPMVRAILAGEKTMTRRPIQPQPPHDAGPIWCEQFAPTVVNRRGEEVPGKEVFGAFDDEGAWGVRCPFGAPGDGLWVREAWRTSAKLEDNNAGTIEKRAKDAGWPSPWAPLEFIADGVRRDWDSPSIWGADAGRYRPPMFMPRWASRLSLVVESIRVERVQVISDEDVACEGVTIEVAERMVRETPGALRKLGKVTHSRLVEPRERWRIAWTLIYGAESWRANSFVWVVAFRRAEARVVGQVGGAS